MLLYHGSNQAVTQPVLLRPERRLDFGMGFYLTSSREQAERWAVRTWERRKQGRPTTTVFEYPFPVPKDLTVLTFPRANADWLEFVAANRRGMSVNDNYDLIVGPVANDQTVTTVTLFLGGFLELEEAIRRLAPQRLCDQYVCKTEKALGLLTLSEVIEQ